MTASAGYLGRGWAFPPQFGPNGSDVAMVAGDDDIVQSLTILFGTALGERVMRQDFGCDVSRYMFEEIDQTLLTSIREAVSDAILYHETRIRLDGVDVSTDGQTPGLVLIAIRFTVRTNNSRFNMVYPYYLNEATRAVP
ncbi:GPW/gp25 family protein [Bradyrhizobium sp. 83012]|uniref:GPW/gp25 family protein n=1 Tax=Bradyrhizobium aeschynomenes TaxID=2734909 RepID=A0ABX2CKX2_9BRAD|nr:GPW/gp25 family protein [Bradyrhizobium aeschynomenes]NPU13615.1 GPW/gp25 family protein [Bradyrhizobium aeschynomenes]NPU68834.1 GPW/gp25 family protein [Bradyrhizobium aeschynomenes]